MSNPINIKNKKAYFNYEILEKLVVGIQLTGTEIKAIREGKITFTDAHCLHISNELWVKGLHISEYSFGSCNNHDPKRVRKLLATRRELNKLLKKIKERGFTIIPLRLFINDRGFAKLEIALGRGKREFDKRENLKKKDTDRDLDRMKKHRR